MEKESLDTTNKQPVKPKSIWRRIWEIEMLRSLTISLIICIFIYSVLLTPNLIQGSSMLPNFHDGELLLTNKITQWLGSTDLGHDLGLDYARGDVVVFQKPGEKDFIKRVIGLPGEKIYVHDGKVFINGHELHEEYLSKDVYTPAGSFLRDNQEKEIPANHYVMMGDNRLDSKDSRYTEVGFVKREWMKGKVFFRYWPITMFGSINTGLTEME